MPKKLFSGVGRKLMRFAEGSNDAFGQMPHESSTSTRPEAIRELLACCTRFASLEFIFTLDDWTEANFRPSQWKFIRFRRDIVWGKEKRGGRGGGGVE